MGSVDQPADTFAQFLESLSRHMDDHPLHGIELASERDRFDETFVDATAGVPYVFTAAGMIAHILTYASYRRTLVAGALASAGAAELDDDPLSWFRPAQHPAEPAK